MGNPWGERFREKTRATVEGNSFHFLRWDPEVIKALRAVRGAALPDPARDIAELVRTGTRQDVLESIGFYEVFLERFPDKQKLIQDLRARLAAVADFEEEIPKEAVVRGAGLRIEPAKNHIGATGKGMLTSLPDVSGGTGQIELDLGVISRPEMRFALGGKPSPGVRVELVEGAAVVRKATPRSDRQLAPETWMLGDLVGRRVTLRIVDDDPKPGVGLRIDGIHWASGNDALRARMRAATGDLAQLFRRAQRELPETDADLVALAGRFALHVPFDDSFPAGTDVKGAAFGKTPATGGVGSQDPVTGFSGRGFLNSYHGGDAPKGRLALPAILLDGQPIEVLVGGGRDCQHTYVGLEVEGRVVSRVCGKNDEVLRPATLSTAAYAGKRGQIVFVDEASGGWGHLLADDILVPAPKK